MTPRVGCSWVGFRTHYSGNPGELCLRHLFEWQLLQTASPTHLHSPQFWRSWRQMKVGSMPAKELGIVLHFEFNYSIPYVWYSSRKNKWVRDSVEMYLCVYTCKTWVTPQIFRCQAVSCRLWQTEPERTLDPLELELQAFAGCPFVPRCCDPNSSLWLSNPRVLPGQLQLYGCRVLLNLGAHACSSGTPLLNYIFTLKNWPFKNSLS